MLAKYIGLFQYTENPYMLKLHVREKDQYTLIEQSI